MFLYNRILEIKMVWRNKDILTAEEADEIVLHNNVVYILLFHVILHILTSHVIHLFDVVLYLNSLTNSFLVST